MSAIAGAVRLSTSARGDGPLLVRRMLGLMAHRQAGQVALVHSPDGLTVLGEGRRSGMAPPSPADVLAVLDGEIYNARPLRHALAFAGQPLASDRPAEIAGRGLGLYGADFLHQLQGRFALALWMPEQRQLLMARDRLGEKPLYYLVHDGLLLFASEIKALAAVLPLRRRIDRVALQRYLALGLVPAPRTLFQGIAKLGPGEMLTACHGEGVRRRSWWQPGLDERKVARVRSLSADQHLLNLRTLLESAVADRLTPEGPLAVILDGQRESRAVAALAERLLGRRLETVRVGTPGSHPARGCRDVRLDVQNVAAILPELVRQLDEPLGDPHAASTWMVSRRLAEAGIATALAGDGAAVLGLEPWTGGDDGPGMSALLRRLRQRLTRPDQPPSLPPSTAHFFAAADIARLLSVAPDALDLGEGVAAPAWMSPEGGEVAAYAELRLALPERLLMRLDKAAMAHGIELRLPFLDHQLVDYVGALPPALRGAAGPALLDRMLDELAPGAGVDNSAPAEDWFDGALGDIYATALPRSRLAELLDVNAALALLHDHRHGRSRHARRLWTLLVLAEWCDLFWIEDELESPGRAAAAGDPMCGA